MQVGFRGARAVRRSLADWWREPVDYAGYVQYFADRGLGGAMRIAVGGGVGFIGVFATIGLLTDASASTISATAMAVFAAVNMFWAGVWWARPLLTHGLSRAFFLTSDLAIAVVALMSSSWLVGFFAFHCFALVSVYLVFFDGPKALALHNGIVLTTVVVFVALTQADHGAGDGTPAGIIIGAVVPVAAATLALQIGIQTMRNDANRSTTDPLTGLLNRRGLHLHFRSLLHHAGATVDDVTTVVVDLDRFKDINDTYGHAAGDDVLIRCAHRIRATVASSALVARVGGEEFVVVTLGYPSEYADLPEQIRYAIAEPADSPAVTASLGVHTTSRNQFNGGDDSLQRGLDATIANADRAMFHAKRHGGNATCHAGR